MASDPNHNPNVQRDPQEVWKDIKLTRARIGELIEQSKTDGDLRPAQAALEELQLKTSNYERLLEEMHAPMKELLGRNFLGTAEWKQGFGVHVGVPPPIPESITPELLNSDCPLHPGEKIKDTHILMLIPHSVDGKPYSALRLAELCAARKGSGARLIHDQEDWANEWKSEPWANASPSESEWMLIPTSDPDPKRVPEERHFRGKHVAEQADVLRHYEANYREAKALEVMTAAVLNDVFNGEPRMLEVWTLLRCLEENASGGRMQVGCFNTDGLKVYDDGDYAYDHVGVALARKL
jgi:hypothetical protein